eukprot:Polyplicarium_translucidae@DN2909_c0_g2_i2.p1
MRGTAAIFMRYRPAIHMAIEKGAEVDAENASTKRNALHFAAASGDSATARELLALPRASQALNTRDAKNWTPLLIAVCKSFERITEILLEHGADHRARLAHCLAPSRGNPVESTSLHFAAIKGNVTIAKLLLAKGAKVDDADSMGRTAMHYAACRRHPTFVQFLLGEGADPSKADSNRRTPLHGAAHAGIISTAGLLMKAGLSPWTSDIWDMTPFALATGA